MGKLEEALEALDIEEWLEEYVEVKTGGISEIRLQDCPKCFNSKWKVYVNVEKRIWFCQRCQWGHLLNDICILLAEVSGKNIHVVRKEIASTVAASLPDSEFSLELSNRLNKADSIEEFKIEPIDLPGQEGFDGLLGQRAINYLLKRGLTQADIDKYKLRLSNKLRNNMGPWAVFPVFYYGLPVACQGRKFTNSQEPKYLSSDRIANWMWPIDEENLLLIEKEQYVVLVEGVFDSLAFIRQGIPALCTFGKNLSRTQIKLLKAHSINKLYLAYDADAHKDIRKLADRIGHLFHTFIIELVPSKENLKADPGDVLSGAVGASWLQEAFEGAIDTRTPEYWNWKLRKELG